MPKKSRVDESREPGGYIALPWTVIDSAAYQNLSHPTKALLIELARQYVRNNNGRLLLSQRYLAGRGWKSGDVILRAKRELLDAKLIYQTVQGHRPNKASWFALTWYTLDKIPGYDDGATDGFRRGMYAAAPVPNPKPTREALFEKWRGAVTGSANEPTSRKILTPAHGVESAAIAPADGVGEALSTPAHGAIRGVYGTLSTPAHGDHLEIPFPTGIQEMSGVSLMKAPKAETTSPDTTTDDNSGQFERIRESDLDPNLYDQSIGEFLQRPAPARNNRAATDAWVAAELSTRSRAGHSV